MCARAHVWVCLCNMNQFYLLKTVKIINYTTDCTSQQQNVLEHALACKLNLCQIKSKETAKEKKTTLNIFCSSEKALTNGPFYIIYNKKQCDRY